MGTIEFQQIGTSRYAPEGANAVCLYAVDGAEGLTLAQLVAAVCIHRCAHLEARAVTRMNKMTVNNTFLDAMASVCSQLVGGANLDATANVPDSYEMRKAARGCTIQVFLETECGVAPTLPGSGETTWVYPKRLATIESLKAKMDSANSTSQQDVIELQSLVNWRDMAYNASSTVVARYGNVGMNTAEKLR